MTDTRLNDEQRRALSALSDLLFIRESLDCDEGQAFDACDRLHSYIKREDPARPQAVVDREALVLWFGSNVDCERDPSHYADALLASGIIKAMPTREQIAECLPGFAMDKHDRLEAADSILDLMRRVG